MAFGRMHHYLCSQDSLFEINYCSKVKTSVNIGHPKLVFLHSKHISTPKNVDTGKESGGRFFTGKKRGKRYLSSTISLQKNWKCHPKEMDAERPFGHLPCLYLLPAADPVGKAFTLQESFISHDTRVHYSRDSWVYKLSNFPDVQKWIHFCTSVRTRPTPKWRRLGSCPAQAQDFKIYILLLNLLKQLGQPKSCMQVLTPSISFYFLQVLMYVPSLPTIPSHYQ